MESWEGPEIFFAGERNILTMEAEIWQRLPEVVLHMILAKLPIRVLGRMRAVCKQWKDLLSSRDAFEGLVPKWSLCCTPGFLIQIHWDTKDDVEFWVIEGCSTGSHIYKVPLLNCIVLNSCKSIVYCHERGDRLALSIGIPGTTNWRHLPRPHIPACFFDHFKHFNGMVFDSSTRRCTVLLGFLLNLSIGQGVNRRMMEMCIYDSESNAWTQHITMVPDHICPFGKGIFCRGKFYWAAVTLDSRIFIAAFNIADGIWTEIPVPQGWRMIYPEDFAEYDGDFMLVDRRDADFIRMWKLNEAGEYEIWCEFRVSGLSKEYFPSFPLVTVNNSGFIVVVDCRLNMSIFSSTGNSIVHRLELPGHSKSRARSVRGFASAFESSNLMWP